MYGLTYVFGMAMGSRLPPGDAFSILDARLAGRFPPLSKPGMVLEFWCWC